MAQKKDYRIDLISKQGVEWVYQVCRKERGGFVVIELGHYDKEKPVKEILEELEARFALEEGQYTLYVG